MILTIVTFKLPKRWTVAEATATFNSTAPKYFRKPGLVRKHYYIDGRPQFAKHPIDDGEKVKIAAIDPDFV